jgi:D-3-phosphoglycerate dehydrogenase
VKALLLENVHPDAADLLRGAGMDVEMVRGALPGEALAERLTGVHLLGIRSKTSLDEAVLSSTDDLVAVGAFCIGTNQIDLATASRRGVAVFNAPFSNTRSVVEMALAEMISLTRRLTEKSAALHEGRWEKSADGAHEMRGRCLGIIGYGNIGSQLSVLAEALGLRVVFYDTADKLALGNAQRCSTLEELLSLADVVSLHVDGRAGNAGLFTAEQFARMRPGSVFLNLSRGFVVDHAALAEAIRSGHLAGAAVDVFPDEPHASGDPFESDLRGLDNVILTPHIGGSTEEAQQDIGRYVAGKLRAYVATGSTTMSVNMPPIALPHPLGQHRVAHVHRNVPGVLATVNRILAEHQVNVEGQLLSTSGDLGYVLTDVGSDLADSALAALRTMPETIRLHVLS